MKRETLPLVLKSFEPCWEETRIVLVDELTIRDAELYISACEACDDRAEITLDYILDELTACDPAITEYLINRPAKCPHCHQKITEKTLVVAA